MAPMCRIMSPRPASQGGGAAVAVQDSLSLGGARAGGAYQAEALDALAARAAADDRAAFEQIYLLVVDDLFAFVRGQCRNETVAEDLTSNAFLKAWRSAKYYRTGTHGYRQWIFGIARNEVRDYWRSSQRTLPILGLDFSDGTEMELPSDPLEARRIVERAMTVLTDDQRQVVVLRYFGGNSHEEIAEIMGKREGAVRALLLRALRRMRKVMADASP